MIARAKRAFPGMVMSLALFAPVFSGHALAATDAVAKEAASTRGSTARRSQAGPASKPVASHAAATKTPVARPAQTHALASRVSPTSVSRVVPRTRMVQPAGGTGRRAIYRTSSPDSVLIDDGTLWRESGNLATWQQTGVASWYGGARWQGHRTTSGSRYDQNELTAAHATLPIGTRVRVTLHDNSSKFVIVTINDRPGSRSRIIDLSRQAAAELGILERGVAMVTLTPL